MGKLRGKLEVPCSGEEETTFGYCLRMVLSSESKQLINRLELAKRSTSNILTVLAFVKDITCFLLWEHKAFDKIKNSKYNIYNYQNNAGSPKSTSNTTTPPPVLSITVTRNR